MQKNVAIVHYNTPELTEAAILSLRKHGGEDYKVYIFDNSDARPFTKKMKGVKIFNNRKGQIFDFDKELAKYPDRDRDIGCSKNNEFASEKHMMSVQKLWELIPDGFILMDSDILIRQSIDWMFNPEECVVGHIAHCYGPNRIERLAPMLLWINVPMCVAGGARFYDPDRSYALHKGRSDPRNYWDTGAALLNDIRKLKPQCHGRQIDIRPLILHFGAGSWIQNDLDNQLKWLEENKSLWYTEPAPHVVPKYSVLTYVFDGYEIPHEIEEKDPEAEYILVTDDTRLKSETWKVFYDGSLISKSGFDKTFQVRFHPFNYVNTDTVIRIDGSIKVKKSLRPIIDAFNSKEYDRALMIHPRRNTVRSEYDVWVQVRQYPPQQAKKCIDFMQTVGYDVDKPSGLYQACFEVVRNNWVNKLVNDMVFDLVRYLGEPNKIDRLDQTVSSFLLNHLFSNSIKIMPVSESLITNSDLLTWYFHKTTRPIADDKTKIPPILFGSPCSPWEPE